MREQPQSPGRPRAHRTLPRWAVLGPLAVALAGLCLLFFGSERISRGARRALTAAWPAVKAAPLVPLPPPDPLPPATNSRPRVAIVIDDIGYNLPALSRLLALGAPLTFAVLPGRPHSLEAAAMIERAGRELLLHQPMEALPPKMAHAGGQMAAAPDPGPGEVRLSMSAEQITAQVGRNLRDFPTVGGMNNHMGSAFTRDRAAMAAALAPLVGSGRYFLDSRTTADSVAFDVARRLGLRVLRRDVFLDHEIDAARIAERFGQLLHLARRQGRALAIGHPHAETLRVLERLVPTLAARGFRLVSAGALARREESENRRVEQAVVEPHQGEVP